MAGQRKSHRKGEGHPLGGVAHRQSVPGRLPALEGPRGCPHGAFATSQRVKKTAVNQGRNGCKITTLIGSKSEASDSGAQLSAVWRQGGALAR
jgi:hypothetical protein